VDLLLRGAAALVTGGSRGIGLATARTLLEEGAVVSIVSRRQESVDRALALLSPLGTVYGFTADVRDDEAVAAAEDAAAEAMGGLDVLIANAGVPGAHANLSEMPSTVWDEVMDTNLRAVFVSCREGARLIRATGRGGRMVLVSSAAAYVAEPHLGHYTAAKAALTGLTKALAVDLAPFEIAVNCVAPGLVDTDQSAEWITPGEPVALVKGPAQASEIAAAITFLASPRNQFIRGTTLVVDGGQIIRGLDGPG